MKIPVSERKDQDELEPCEGLPYGAIIMITPHETLIIPKEDPQIILAEIRGYLVEILDKIQDVIEDSEKSCFELNLNNWRQYKETMRDTFNIAAEMVNKDQIADLQERYCQLFKMVLD